MEFRETHPCVGCSANAKLTRKERAGHGGFYLTFTCLRCGTKEILKAGGNAPSAETCAELQLR
jgi:hypothetical protein